ncbi:MAG: PepSY domain-containing protein [Candidatus Aenigmarchaeota archaeon]|nr:PepSY domain-containing protein [Candidatus Aenigmarchaeota archaeon]
MEFEEALHKAGSFIKEAKAKGYFLCSVFSSSTTSVFDEWILHFAGKDSALDCYIRGDAIHVDETRSIGEPVELNLTKVKVSISEALDSVGKPKSAVSTLVSLHRSPPVWTINFIKADMTVTTFDVNAETGKITREETASILKRD